jgi:hypothetical protein
MITTTKTFKQGRIELKRNNCISNDACTLCGARCDPDGYDYFLANTWALVCDECAAIEAPQLVARRQGQASPKIVTALIVVTLSRSTLYGFDSSFNPYLLGHRDYSWQTWQHPEPHPDIVTLAQGLLLTGVNAHIHYLNSDGTAVDFVSTFGQSALQLQPTRLSDATSAASLEYLDCNNEVRVCSIDAAVFRADLSREMPVDDEGPF